MNAPWKFADVAALVAATPPQWQQRELVDPAQLREQLQAAGVIRKPRAREFVADVLLDDDAVKAAALQIVRTEIGSSQHRLERVLSQCDDRIGVAIRALVARRGLPREAA